MEEGWDFPTDTFMEILLCVPPSSRRRLCLVCRHWRDIIVEWTFVEKSWGYSASAYVIDDLPEGPCREPWTDGLSLDTFGYFETEMVGTRNGLRCLCDNTKPDGAITLANPAYSFAYHLRTGQYKIVHVPCYFDRTGQFDVVQVFMLGEASLRDVHAPAGASCCLTAGLINVDGAAYWVTKGAELLVSTGFDD
ncbi:uncharacterized protein LOC133895172 [Phragmites australis]|uniref:uncharacterized protein LOC133895172 n=1 Tax=Phragmites australis TaxID=29695 RepID=UPI002D790476|nr:uncharacterized protein LOC133895172 [Phragmites australis]